MVEWTTGSIFFSTAPFLNNKLFIWPNYKYSYNNTDDTFALPFSPFLFLSFYSSISLRSWLYEIQSEKTAKLIYELSLLSIEMLHLKLRHYWKCSKKNFLFKEQHWPQGIIKTNWQMLRHSCECVFCQYAPSSQSFFWHKLIRQKWRGRYFYYERVLQPLM